VTRSGGRIWPDQSAGVAAPPPPPHRAGCAWRSARPLEVAGGPTGPTGAAAPLRRAAPAGVAARLDLERVCERERGCILNASHPIPVHSTAAQRISTEKERVSERRNR